ncbi:hypothetical protein [Gloeothece verrucosa]|nr:hypothetical protein [Gloeothece verrucosa]
MQGALIAFAQSFLQMQALKAEEEKKQEKEKKDEIEPQQSQEQSSSKMTGKNETNGKSDQVAIENNELNGKKEVKLENKPKDSVNTEEKEKDQASEVIPFIQIWQHETLIKGKTDKGKEINNLDVALNSKLEVAYQLAQPGQQIKGLENVEVKFQKEDKTLTFFKTDNEGKVEINANFSSSQQQVKSQQQKESPGFSKALETKAEGNPDILSQLINDFQVFREEMKTEIRAGFKDEVQQAVDEALKERLKNLRDYKWWQKASQGTGRIWDLWRTKRQEQSAASTVLQLWKKHTVRGDRQYKGNDYTILRKGDLFKLQDNEGQELLRFKTNSFGGVMLIDSNLDENHLNAIKILKNALKTGDVTDSFATEDRLLSVKEARSTRLMDEFVILAKQSTENFVKIVDKEEKYLVKATPKGQIGIMRLNAAENTYETIFQRSFTHGNFNHMTTKDLDYIENMLDMTKKSQREIERQVEQRRNEAPARRGRGR